MAPTPRTDTKDRVADALAKGLSVRDIALLLGISTQAVYRTIKRYGLPSPIEKAT